MNGSMSLFKVFSITGRDEAAADQRWWQGDGRTKTASVDLLPSLHWHQRRLNADIYMQLLQHSINDRQLNMMIMLYIVSLLTGKNLTAMSTRFWS